ncbi:MAG: Anti-sigma factor antagonist, partial [Candidatus Hydrogenedentes bacterium]|nr:Anti-sigma factor antagonist [Candidatus Hydrogenedentota bacterium]
MKFERIEMGPVTVLRLEGNIDEDGVNQLRVGLLRCIKERRFNLVVNLTGIRL